MNTTDHHQTKASNVVLAGKTARACDSCLLKRARWFCASDDAFLCQGCDTSVHSANQLAIRHKRVRLETSSFKVKDHSLPAWHRGFTRKARTPRPAKRLSHQPILPLVPEINSSEDQPSVDESDEQLFFRVPVFDAFAEELHSEIVKGGDDDHDLNLEELLSSCNEGFDVEGLLDLGFGITDELKIDEGLDGKRSVKIEEINVDDGDEEVQAVIAACHDVELNWNFDYTTNEIEIEIEEGMKNNMGNIETDEVEKRMLLRLNYEAVMAAWDSQGSCPWTDGIRPQFNLDDHESVGGWLGGGEEWGGEVGRSWGAGREARVSRYREKRRTRLFSKKIRYEVRKLNADKRPRMKGRFVKRTSSFSLSHHLINN